VSPHPRQGVTRTIIEPSVGTVIEPSHTLSEGARGDKGPNNGREERDRLVADFVRFWTAYPKRRAKPVCRDYWIKTLSPAPELVEAILQAVKRQRRLHEWTRDAGRWIPCPERYLKEERWTDSTETGEAPHPSHSGPHFTNETCPGCEKAARK